MQRAMRSTHCSVTELDRRRFLGLAGAALIAGGCGSNRSPADGVPQSEFDEDSTAEDVTSGLDLNGKLAVVTGCTSGIGLETMRVLALRGAYVIGTSRSLQRAEEACRSVVGITTPVQLDLGDFDSVARCAEDILTLNAPIDMLICNAGILGASDEPELINGLNRQFVVNHLGHFILVNRLLSRMYHSPQGRVVMVSSRSAYRDAPEEGILFDDLAFSREYDWRTAYGHSKLANALFSLRLAELLRGTRITSNALHPGVINTEIDRDLNGFMQWGFGVLTAVSGKTIEEGAATSCYVATSPDLGATSGQFFEDCNAVTIHGEHHLYDTKMAERLMAVSQELTADYLVEQKIEDPRERWRKNDE